MTKELYIAGERVVLDDKQAIAPTYQAFDVAELTRIKFDFTNTFTLPYCEINDKIFDNAFRVQSQSSKRYLANECKLIIGGKELISNGVAEFIGTDDKGYKVVCYSLPLSFFNDIALFTIRDLDYSIGYNHLNSIATVAASRNNTSKYIYPLIDWHINSPNEFIFSDKREIDTRYMMPCLFYEEILEKIFTEAGYTLNNLTKDFNYFDGYDLVLTTDCKNAYLLYLECLNNSDVPPSNGFFNIVGGDVVESWALLLENTFVKGEDRLLITKQANFNITSTDNNWTNDMSLTGLAPIDTDTYRFRYEVNMGFGINPNPSSSVIALAILEDNGNGNLSEIYRETKTPINATPQNLAWDFFINLTGGVKYFIQVTQITPVLNNPFIKFNSQQILLDKVNVFIKPYIPEIKQTDFIKNYLQLTGSILTYDNYTNIFTIERFDKVIKNKPNAKDWTHKKYDNTKKPIITHKFGNYGVSNAFRYEDDENDFKHPLADGFINSTNQNLNKEHEVLKLLFASSVMINTLSGLNIAKINTFEKKTGQITIGNDTFEIPLGAKFRGEIVPRILLVRRETVSLGVRFTDGTNTTTTPSFSPIAIAHFVDTSQTSNLGFGSNILDTFYQWLQSILNDTIVIEDEYKLSEADVANDTLDFLTPVYLQQHNNYFYINEIRNFIRDKKTKVKLIKV